VVVERKCHRLLYCLRLHNNHHHQVPMMFYRPNMAFQKPMIASGCYLSTAFFKVQMALCSRTMLLQLLTNLVSIVDC